MRAIPLALALAACAPVATTVQTTTPLVSLGVDGAAKPIAPLGPHDGLDDDQAWANSAATRTVPRTIVLSSNGAAASSRCSIPIAARSQTLLADDETRIAVRTGNAIAIWNPRTCRATTLETTGLAGMTFIGSSHDLLLVHDDGGVRLSRIAHDGNAELAGVISQRATSWATSPDGKLAVVGVSDETRTTLAVWDLTGDRAMFEIRLPMVEREIDSITFSKDSKTARITVPVYAANRRSGDLSPRSHLAIDYDTTTWRPLRKVVANDRY
jgi:hypothetical protein